MSKQTMSAINDAIEAHMADVSHEGMLIDWVVGYATINGDEGFSYGYATNHSTPHASLGLFQMSTELLAEDIGA